MKKKHGMYLFIIILLLSSMGIWIVKRNTLHSTYTIGQKIDSLNGVYVFYNGDCGNITGRNTAADGYNIGLKYQCVEFVKRYYFEHLHHKMPDSYGHAKDFFDRAIADGQKNKKRNLTQYTNPSLSKPKVNDLVIFDGTHFNSYGHVAIICKVTDDEIEIIQQNPGPSSPSRVTFDLDKEDGKWKIDNKRILGWLRKV